MQLPGKGWFHHVNANGRPIHLNLMSLNFLAPWVGFAGLNMGEVWMSPIVFLISSGAATAFLVRKRGEAVTVIHR